MMEIRAERISRTFFRNGKGTNVFTAVFPVDLTLTSGVLTAIVGRSGSGKSTLANMLAGLLTPSGGRVLANGEDLYASDEKSRAKFRNEHIGVVPQGRSGLAMLTVTENVLLPAAICGKADAYKSRAKLLLDGMGIGALCEVFARELSGGEARRMAIARALLMKPDVVIADEPTGDLDGESTLVVMKLFRKVCDEGAAVLVVTHEKDALPFADRVFRMEQGVLGTDEKE